jgi:hypothetical protein
MATLTSKDSYDKIKYSLDLENSSAHFELFEVESVRNNVVLVQAMVDRLFKEDVNYVSITFPSKGSRLEKKTLTNEKGEEETVTYRVHNRVCYIPKQHDVNFVSRNKNGDATYAINLKNFVKFYKCNLDNIIQKNHVGLKDLNNDPDEEGWVTVRNIKRELGVHRRQVLEEAEEVSKRVRNKLRNEFRELNEKDNSDVNSENESDNENENDKDQDDVEASV